MSKKRYMEGRNQALEQIIQEQQSQLETKDFIIDAQTKENDRHVLTFKFIVDILLLISQLEKVLADNTVLSDAIKLAIATFKVELSKAIQTIQYDGGYSYTFDTSINNNNNDWNYEET
jgi:hypothetical protein